MTRAEAHHAVNSDVIFSEQELSHILTNRRVLVVEDNPMNQEIAMRLLAKKGIHVETADDGVRGVERFQQSSLHYYDAILMDIRMPNLNGIEATKAIRLLEREDAETIPIIAMTADAYEEDRKQSLEAGMDEHLSKPVNTQQLYQALARLIRQ